MNFDPEAERLEQRYREMDKRLAKHVRAIVKLIDTRVETVATMIATRTEKLGLDKDEKEQLEWLVGQELAKRAEKP